MEPEVFSLLPWVAGGVSAIVNALFIAYVASNRGRIRDLKAELKEEKAINANLREMLRDHHGE
jgi:hypothetical protein